MNSGIGVHGMIRVKRNKMLGHSNLSTTLAYIYNPLTEERTVDLINKVFLGNN